MNTRFFEENGKLKFGFCQQVACPSKNHSSAFRVYNVSGFVPKSVISKGEDAIKKYAEKKIEAYIKKQKKLEEAGEKSFKNTNISISATLGGKTLKGRVVYSAKEEDLVVRLEKPVKSETVFMYGNSFASAMAGHRVFKAHDKTMTEGAIQSAKETLVELYQNWRNKDIIKLAENLNTK